MSVLVYGAYGYTGQLVVDRARALGLDFLISGRDPARCAALATSAGVDARPTTLDDSAALDRALAGVKVVLHCAGPFSRTARPMVDACLRNGVHYLDITGEIEVFEAVAARGPEAERAGVMLMPGVGFDVVPTDCLAAHLKRRLPDANHLRMALRTNGRMSHGTATTMRENLHRGGCVRRGGRLVLEPTAAETREFDFGAGAGLCPAIRVPWGDVSTAWYTTGIPDIDLFAAMPLGVRVFARASNWVRPVLGSRWFQAWMKARIEAAPAGPTAEQRARGRFWIYGEAVNASGQKVAARVRAMDGYDFTALAATEIARRALAGETTPGFRTPAMQYGPDLCVGWAGVEREDV
ncbi:MAG: saccharopine dehydrogenase family protein [Bradymonadia bacterium]|jgi:short subunit dehydrogenase-like uncharacterized protein